MNTLPSLMRVGVRRYSMVRISVRIWKPSTSASVQMMILLHFSWERSKAPCVLPLALTSTPQPMTFKRSTMISLLKMRS